MSLKITLGSIIAYRNENHFQFIKFFVLSNFNFSTEVSNVTLIMTNFASIFPGVVQSFNFWMYKKTAPTTKTNKAINYISDEVQD